jgi:hypothetical protein
MGKDRLRVENTPPAVVPYARHRWTAIGVVAVRDQTAIGPLSIAIVLNFFTAARFFYQTASFLYRAHLFVQRAILLYDARLFCDARLFVHILSYIIIILIHHYILLIVQ